MNPSLRILAVVLCGIATPLEAAPAKVRSGEHQGFSRIVIEGAASGEWQLRRTADGYMFRPADSKTSYDIGQVYYLIPRTRIADLRAAAGGVLNLNVSCDCHAKAFATPKQALVIDVLDGPAEADSPFEILATGTQSAVQTIAAPAGPDAVADGLPYEGPTPPAWQPFSRPGLTSDSHLDLYWKHREPPATSDGAARQALAPATEYPPTAVARTRQVSRKDETGPSPDAAQEMRRTDEMRRTLLEQLSRAASQGLVALDTPTREHRRPPRQPDLPAQEPAALPVREGDTLPLHITTSIDRDAIFADPPTALTADGAECPSDAFFSLDAWGDDRPAALQIAAARAALVGEFDRPDSAQVFALARLYIHFGFGAEARMTLRSFDLEGEAATWIDLLARIEDGETVKKAGLAALADCDGPVALWALLGSNPPVPQSALNGAAIQRSFSELPLHLRRQLGPSAIERLIAAGATDIATALRNAVLRAGGPPEPALTVASSALAIETGDAATGLSNLDALARGNSASAEDALMRAIRLRLDRSEAVPPDLAAIAGALAYEYRYDTLGPELAVLQILALASTGDFASAFAAEAHWDTNFPADLRSDALLQLFARLASEGDEWSLVHHYFANRDRLLESGPDILLRLDLAERLTSAGFDSAAAQLLNGEAETTERGRLMLARHAVDADEPERALALISPADGADAARLRAEAFVQAGQPEKAKAQFSAAGDLDGAAQAAWLAGNWPEVDDNAPAPLASAVRLLGLVGTDRQTDKTAPEGELAAGRRLVEDATAARAALTDLLSFVATD